MDNRKLHWVTVTYFIPMSGTVQVFADNIDHAKEIVTEAHKHVKDFEIVDAYALTEEQKAKALGEQLQQMEFDFDPSNKEKLN